MMDGGEKARQDISALADGELDAVQAGRLLKGLRAEDLRETWNVYHQIGDVIRADAMAAAVSPDFSRRFAERLAAEPTLLAPRRSLLRRLGHWPTTLAAVAAAGFGFFVAPSLFNGTDAELPAVSPSQMARVSHGAVLADGLASVATADAGSSDYLLMHQAAHPQLYGMAPLARPAILDSGADQ